MASVHGVVNHLKYIRSNTAVLAAGSALILGAALVAGPVIESAGNAKAYHDNSGQYYDYSDYSDDYSKYADNYARYSDNYGKYLDNYEQYTDYSRDYDEDRKYSHDDGYHKKSHKNHKDYTDYKHDDDKNCRCYKYYVHPTSSEYYSLDTPYYYGGQWHSEPTPEPTPTDEPEPEPTYEPEPELESEEPTPTPTSSSVANANANAVANVTVKQTPQRVVKQASTVVQAQPAPSNGAGAVYSANPKGGPIELPKTGEEDTITGIIGLTSAIVAGSLYAVSRRELRATGFER